MLDDAENAKAVISVIFMDVLASKVILKRTHNAGLRRGLKDRPTH